GVGDVSPVFVASAIGIEGEGVAVHGHRRLHHRLAERRVRVDVAAELPGVALEELRQRGLSDELGRAVADDVCAQQLPGLGVGDDLDEAAGLAVDLRPADGREGELADLHLEPLLARLLLGQPDRRDLRVRVGAASDEVLVHRGQTLAGDVLRGDYAFLKAARSSLETSSSSSGTTRSRASSSVTLTPSWL